MRGIKRMCKILLFNIVQAFAFTISGAKELTGCSIQVALQASAEHHSGNTKAVANQRAGA